MEDSQESIIDTINFLGDCTLTATSHLYPQMGSIKIKEAATIHSEGYFDNSERRPAVALIEVVLSANRSYVRHVKPNIDRISETSDIASFKDLINLIELIGVDAFYKFWGHRNEQKFSVLIGILNSLPSLKLRYPHADDDYELMNSWANSVDLTKYNTDIIGSIRYVAIATLQHLRMTFGCNTVKPDLRVKEVLMNEFKLGKLSDIKTIKVIEQMSIISGLSTLMLDQIFVNYGSGYYNKVEGPLIQRRTERSCNANKKEVIS